VVWITGPRIGKYTGGQPNAIPGHNIIQVLFGCLLALAGWSAFEVAASVLFYRAPEERLVLVPSECAVGIRELLCWQRSLYTRLRFRKPDASICANGWVAGLVAQSVGGCYLSPAMSIVVGAVAGALAPFLIEMIEFQLLIDDPGGAIAIHLGAGLWGVMAGALFAETGQALSLRVEGALVVIATLLGLVFPLLHCINLVVAKLVAFRVDRDGDWHGMDIRELGSGAYPEFVLHADDTIPR
jgi:Amt family ammonium transporter